MGESGASQCLAAPSVAGILPRGCSRLPKARLSAAAAGQGRGCSPGSGTQLVLERAVPRSVPLEVGGGRTVRGGRVPLTRPGMSRGDQGALPCPSGGDSRSPVTDAEPSPTWWRGLSNARWHRPGQASCHRGMRGRAWCWAALRPRRSRAQMSCPGPWTQPRDAPAWGACVCEGLWGPVSRKRGWRFLPRSESCAQCSPGAQLAGRLWPLVAAGGILCSLPSPRMLSRPLKWPLDVMKSR